jgi:plasmid stabilization system protein ParE
LAATVVLTSTAARDLSQVQLWLHQPGSGRRSKAVAQRIVRAIRRLARTAAQHPVDRFNALNQQLVVAGYVISYRRVRDDRQEFVFVERIYGPGQER